MNLNVKQIAGAAALVVGAVLLWFAYNASQAPVEEVTEAVTGRYSDQTIWYLVLGIIGVVGGGLLLLVGRRGS